MPSTSILAFGFGNLAMLGWLAAVAAPLVIHLWSRHRHREAPWAAMQFLLAAMRKNARRLQLQQWLLLAVRMLIIALVVLAVAEPYGERLLAGLGSGPIHKIIVIDGSYSMGYRDDGETRFERAKRIAVELMRDSQLADSFTVILIAEPSEKIVGREVLDHAAVTSQIETLTQRHTGADLAGALKLVDDAITRGAANPGASNRQQVYFLTDLQRIPWQQASQTNTQPGSVLQRIAALAKQAEIAVIDLGDAQSSNTAVTNLTTADSIITVGREITFDATLRRFGPAASVHCTVELLVDSIPVSEQMIDLVTGADMTVHFNHRFPSPGEHSVEVRSSSDHLEIDNARWLVVPVREAVRVLCVAGRPGAAKYVADALNPSPTGDSAIRPIIVSEGDLADVELAGFDCVFLCNVAQLTAGEASRLKQYARAGGGVVFFLGDRIDRENYSSRATENDPLLPAALGDVVSQQQFGIDPLDYRHPIVAPFRGRERAGLLTTPLARHYRLELPNNRPEVEVAAALKNGDPLIVTQPLGNGRTVLIATDGSLSSVDATSGEPWTHWPTWPSFLPVIRELLAYATSGRQQQWQQLVGTPLASRVARSSPWRGVPAPDENALASSPHSMLKIQRPDNRTDAISVQSTPSGPEWTYNYTDLSGLYKLRGLPSDASPGATLHESPSPQLFAVNVDTRESDLSQIESQQLPAEFHVIRAADEFGEKRDTPGVSRAGWNESLLWSALALILVESFLAWHFGRGAL